MAVFESKLDKRSDAYAKNRADQLEKLAYLRELEQRAVDASERRRARFERCFACMSGLGQFLGKWTRHGIAVMACASQMPQRQVLRALL